MTVSASKGTKGHRGSYRKLATKKQLGLSAVELMVAMVIGLFLVGGTITVYLQTGNTYRTSDKVARLQEIGRYAFDVIEPDVRLAGLWGNAIYIPAGSEGNVTNSVADTAITPNCGANWIGDAANYVDGRDNGAVLSATCSASNTRSDALIIRRTSVAPAVAVTADKIQVQSTRMAAAVFNGTSVPAEFDSSMSTTHDLIVRAYYVTQASASAPFVLRRRTLSKSGAGFQFNEEEVIPGIQDLQVQFGVDGDNDNQADQYVDPGATAGRRIVSARIWLLVVADEVESDFDDPAVYAYANRDYGVAFTDKRRRILMTKTIQIRNARLL